jgi:hypothetical protein
MSGLYDVLVILHLVLAAMILVGYAMQLRAPAAGPIMTWGARLQLLVGLAIVGLGEASLDMEYNHAKVAVKLVVAVAIVALVEISRARAKRDEAQPVLVHGAAGLTVVNVLVASFWK